MSKSVKLLISITVFVFGLSACNHKNTLSLWNDTAPAKQELTAYVKAVTKKGSPDYIPPENRIAVFDFDGTLFNETDPIYIEWILYTDRVLDDPAYKDKATPAQIVLAKEIRQAMKTRVLTDEMEKEHALKNIQVFKDMPLEEFKEYIRNYANQEEPGYTGMKKGEAYYKPMLQVIDYLLAHKFIVYVCSGTDRFIIRTLLENVVPIPARQIIGSDNTIVAKGQHDTDGLDYIYKHDDELVQGGELIVKNVKMNKPSVIAREIGVQPVLSFGNSSGDASMANYVITGNKYKALAFMLLCDDTEREYGNPAKAQKMQESCKENGWIPVSMRDDWKTIYGDGVKRK
ncbi:MAG: haloacid dehalogenase-like hydrolase [Elusimicrobiaceae bacterium]|nr:haloacid dehalogenase-like hydrolase [Elusimicrobiaceae bacterium]